MFSGDTLTRVATARTTTDPEVLEILAYDPSWDVRRHVAWNKHTPADIIAMLARDSVAKVTYAAQQNPNCPTDILDDVVRHVELGNYCYAFDNGNISPEVITEFYDFVQNTICDPEFEDNWSNGEYDEWWCEMRCALALNPHTPMDILGELAEDYDAGVRECVARNPNTPVEWLYSYAEDEDEEVIYAAVCNPNADESVLSTALSFCPRYDIMEAIAEHPNATPRLLHHIETHNYATPKIVAKVRLNPNYVPNYTDDGEA